MTKNLQAIQPKSATGYIAKKTAQAVSFTAHKAFHATEKTVLGAETLSNKVFKGAEKSVRRKYVQKYRQEAVDDYHKGVIRLSGTAVDAVKGTYSHFKQKKQFRLEKTRYKIKKAEYKIFREEQLKPKLAKSRLQLRKNKEKKSEIKWKFNFSL